MKVIGLDHYNLCGPRDLLERMRDFYVDVLGLQVGYRPPFGSFGYWLYAGDTPVLHLSESTQSVGVPTAQSSFDHAAFRCSGLEAFTRRLDEYGIGYRRALIPELDWVQLFLCDPVGNGVELNFPEG
jgi:catechol 2,3-dioxygenase-like lactoylglutathione lyase family enzyme